MILGNKESIDAHNKVFKQIPGARNSKFGILVPPEKEAGNDLTEEDNNQPLTLNETNSTLSNGR